MTWRNEPMCGLDFETDSPDPEDAHIVTACVGYASGDGWNPRNWILQTTRPIPAGAQAVHGITTEYADETGMDHSAGLVEIRDALHAAWALGAPVVGHNILFDFTVLDRDLRRHGLGGFRVSGPVIDTLVLDKATHQFRKGSRKLIDVAAHHGVPLDEADAHGAEADVRASCRIAWKLAALTPDPKVYASRPPLGSMSLRDLHAFQVEAFEDQRRSFIEYRRRKGEPLDDESLDWPIRPWLDQPAVA